MSLQNFCRRPLFTLGTDKNIVEACQLMRDKNIGCLLVVEGDKLRGILTDRDIALKVAGEKRDPQTTKVGEVMTQNPVSISVDKDLRDLTALMHAYHVRRVPITNGVDHALGIVSLDDLIAMFGDEMFDIGKAVSEAAIQGPAWAYSH